MGVEYVVDEGYKDFCCPQVVKKTVNAEMSGTPGAPPDLWVIVVCVFELYFSFPDLYVVMCVTLVKPYMKTLFFAVWWFTASVEYFWSMIWQELDTDMPDENGGLVTSNTQPMDDFK